MPYIIFWSAVDFEGWMVRRRISQIHGSTKKYTNFQRANHFHSISINVSVPIQSILFPIVPSLYAQYPRMCVHLDTYYIVKNEIITCLRHKNGKLWTSCAKFSSFSPNIKHCFSLCELVWMVLHVFIRMFQHSPDHPSPFSIPHTVWNNSLTSRTPSHMIYDIRSLKVQVLNVQIYHLPWRCQASYNILINDDYVRLLQSFNWM